MTAGGDNLKTTIIGADGTPTVVPDYATVQGILIGVVAAFVLFITIIGPENHGSHFEQHKPAFEEGAGRDDAMLADDVPPRPQDPATRSNEKGSVQEGEVVIGEKA